MAFIVPMHRNKPNITYLYLTFKVKFNKSPTLPHFELVHTITHHPEGAKYNPNNFGGQLTLTFKVKFNLKSPNFWFHHYLKYITHHITTSEP